MRNYVTVVFDDTAGAYEGLHSLWQLDDAAEVTILGTAVVHRDALGNFQVDTKDTNPALATAVAENRDAATEARFVLGAGQSAVIADVIEDWTSPIDTRMAALGGTVFRRAEDDVADDVWFDDDYFYPYYLYPYEYIPSRYSL